MLYYLLGALALFGLQVELAVGVLLASVPDFGLVHEERRLVDSVPSFYLLFFFYTDQGFGFFLFLQLGIDGWFDR